MFMLPPLYAVSSTCHYAGAFVQGVKTFTITTRVLQHPMGVLKFINPAHHHKQSRAGSQVPAPGKQAVSFALCPSATTYSNHTSSRGSNRPGKAEGYHRARNDDGSLNRKKFLSQHGRGENMREGPTTTTPGYPKNSLPQSHCQSTKRGTHPTFALLCQNRMNPCVHARHALLGLDEVDTSLDEGFPLR